MSEASHLRLEGEDKVRNMEQINNLLRIEKKGNERADLIKFFVDNLKQKNKKPFSARMIAIKMSHLSLQDIRYMISVFKDIQNRKGNISAQKWFFWSLKI